MEKVGSQFLIRESWWCVPSLVVVSVIRGGNANQWCLGLDNVVVHARGKFLLQTNANNGFGLRRDRFWRIWAKYANQRTYGQCSDVKPSIGIEVELNLGGV